MIGKVKELLDSYTNSCIVTDFDYTLTDYSSYSSIGVFSNYLCDEYVNNKKLIDKRVFNTSLDMTSELYYLWKEKILLLHKYASMEVVNKIVSDDNFVLRNEMINLLTYAYDHSIDVYIISSGCKEIIEAVLRKNKINYKNIEIISNSFISCNKKVITPSNKKEFFDKEYSLYIIIGDDKRDFFIKKNCYYIEYFTDPKFRILTNNKNKKCNYGLCLYKGNKAFYKTVFDGIKNELKGYKLVSKYYMVPKIIYYSENVILYEYIDDFIDKSLYDYLYGDRNLHIDYNYIFNQYKESLKSVKYIQENKLKNDLFYNQRISIIDKYISSDEYSKYKNIFIAIKKRITKDKKLYSFISQGDPTDTNITTTGIFCDFENGGYNSIVGEIAIFIVSILSHGAYIYPKYNSKVYDAKKLKKYKNYITNKNIELLLEYLNIFKMNLNKNIIKELDTYLKYYICFRIVSPIDIDILSENDREFIFYLLNIFYNAKNFNQIINIIRRWNYEI